MNQRSAGFGLGTFSIAGCAPFGALVLGEQAVALAALEPLARSLGARLTGTASVLDLLRDWDANLEGLTRVAAALADERTVSGAPCRDSLVDLSLLRAHPPVHLPRQVLCSGANYRQHVIDLIVDQGDPECRDMSPEERRAYGTRLMDQRATTGAPFFFAKLPSAITGPHDPIVLAESARQPDWELELGVVIGRPTYQVSRAQALDAVAGYTIVNDISNRGLLYRTDVKGLGADWIACKSAPSYLPTGPLLVPRMFVPDPQALRITLKLNGETMQDESTADMIFDIARLIEHASHYSRLLPGDLICTGSPAGNGTHYNRFLRPGDVVEGAITGLGIQRNICVAV